MGTKKGQRRITYGRRGTPTKVAYRFPSRTRRTNGALTKANKTISAQRGRMSRMRKQMNNNFVVSPNPGHLKLPAVGAITAGGAAQGALSVYFPQIAGINSGYIIGGAFVAVSMFVKNETAAGALGCIGSGMLSSTVSDTVANMLSPESIEVA